MVAKGIRNSLITTGKWALVMGVMLGVCFWLIAFVEAPAFAEETAGEAALDVCLDEQCIASFSMQDLQTIASREGSRKYTYSGFNTYPTPQLFEAVEGPTVEGILDSALAEAGRRLEDIGDAEQISFRAGDGVEETFLKGTLLAQRYYYPQFRLEQGRTGQAVLAASKADPVSVPAVISLREEGAAYGESGRYEVGRLLFGQVSPSEQNHAMFVKYLVTGNKTNAGQRGRITIHTRTASALQPIQAAQMGPDGVSFDRSVNASHTEGGARYWIYYTTDGSVPSQESDLYNYNNNAFGQAGERIHRPQAGQTLTVKVFAYDRPASAVSTFRFPGKATIGSLKQQGKMVTVKWKKAAGASGYQIWRAEKKTGKKLGAYKLVKTVKKGGAGSWKNTNLKKGTTYYYRIRAYRQTAGTVKTTGYGSDSAVKHIKVK